MKSKSKKVRKLKGPLLNVAQSMGKWRPQDDYILIQSILHLEDVKEVHSLVKFTKKFSEKELEERWYAFLYDESISKMIRKNIKKIHVDDISRLDKKVPFNDEENFLLLNLESKIDPTEKFFEEFLIKNRIHYHSSRTTKCLIKQFNIFKKLNMLKDQLMEENLFLFEDETNKSENLDTVQTFEKLENGLDDDVIDNEIDEIDEKTVKDIDVTYEALVDNIKKAEADLFLWQGLIDKIQETSNPFEEPNCLALIFSENFSHIMSKRDITFGRSKNADCDLSPHELFSKKISRNQFKITMLDSNLFILINNGKLPIFVDGKIIQQTKKTQLFDKSIIEIGDLSMLFLINYNNICESKLNANELFNNLI